MTSSSTTALNDEPPDIAEARRLYQRILVPVDFTTRCRRAVAVAIDWQRRYNGELYLMHLAGFDSDDEFLAGLGSPPRMDSAIRDADERLARLAESIAPG